MIDNNNISEFDGFFRETLSNASQTPPPGVWEAVSGAMSAGAATTTAVAVKTTLWMKIGIATIAATTAVIATVYLTDSKEQSQTMPAVQETQQAPVQEVPVVKENEVSIAEAQLPVKETQSPESIKPKAEIPPVQDKQAPVAFIESPKTNNSPADIKAPEIKQESSKPTAVTPDSKQVSTDNKDIINSDESDDSTATSDGNTVTYRIVQRNSDSALRIPNVFTPNGDGKNDTYLIDIRGESSVKIQIFDTWGKKLFETTDKTIGWEASADLYPVGTYLVIVTYKFPNSAQKTFSGPIKLIR